MYFFTGLYDIDLGFTNYLPSTSTFTFVLLNVSISSLILGTDIDIEFLT